ncbi:MAG TPA: hypothetical protein VGQ36_07760 [Thermoanaerobaculia bacterium]|nr:hypothetical protein [Thermoanaerobaculia bacterium]
MSILLLLTLACASTPSQRPANVPQPNIDAELLSPLFFGSGNSAPATIEVRVTNRGNVPIVVRRIELDSPGMVQYTLRRYMREHNETVGPGETKPITVFATAVTTVSRPTEPLAMRAIVHFRAEGKSWREILITR